MPNQAALREIIVKELKLQGIAPAEQDKIIARLGELIMKAIMIAIFSKLPVSTKPEYERIQAEGSEEKMNTFFEKHIPNFEELVTEEIKRTIGEYKRLVSTA